MAVNRRFTRALMVVSFVVLGCGAGLIGIALGMASALARS